MAFQIKNFISIAAGMINHMRGSQSAITDFNVGSVARTLVEAPAVEIDQLYQQMWNGLRDAIPVATFNSFNFPALVAEPASGVFTVTIGSQATDTLIPAGTALVPKTGGASYITESDVVIASGFTTANVLAAASTAGAATNLPAATQMTMTPVPAGFVSAANATALTNGTDAETQDQRLQRFREFISTISRGPNDALVYGAKTAALLDGNGLVTEQVKSAVVIEPWILDPAQPIGLVDVYIHNGVGATSGALVTQCTAVLYGYTDALGNKIVGYKAAGVKVVVAAATEVPVAMTAVLTAAPGYVPSDLVTAVEAALSGYALGLDIGVNFLFAEAVDLCMSIPGVANIVFSTPTADVAITASQKATPGTLTITHT